MSTTPIALHTKEEERVTVYYSYEEGWIHLLTFDSSVEVKAETAARSQVLPYSEAQMRYLRVRAEANPNIYIFQAKRDTP